MSHKLFLVFLVSLLFQLFSGPKAVFSEQKDFQVGPRDKLFAVHFLDEKTGWVVGDEGLLLKTEDGGNTWSKIETISKNPFNSITFIDNKSGWIVGRDGLILYTDDGGQHWKKQESNTQESLMKIVFLSKNKGFAVGLNGTVLWTEDGGLLWQPFSFDWITILPEKIIDKGIFAPNLYDIFFSGEAYGWIVGENGLVLFTSDGGEEWELLRIGLFPPLFSVYFKDESEGWAAGQNGLLLYTQDGGKRWTKVSVPADASLFKIRMSGEYGIVVGDRGTVLQSIDGGRTWDRVQIEMRLPLPWLMDVCINRFKSAGKVICVGESIIMKLAVISTQLE